MAEMGSVRQLHPAIGAEVHGVDLRRPPDAALLAAIRQAWLRHAVLVFPEQAIDDEAQIAFSRCFGALERTVIAGISSDRLPEIYVLSNVGDDGRLIAPEDPAGQPSTTICFGTPTAHSRRSPAQARSSRRERLRPRAGRPSGRTCGRPGTLCPTTSAQSSGSSSPSTASARASRPTGPG